MLYLMMSKRMTFSARKVLKICRSALFGTPGIDFFFYSCLQVKGMYNYWHHQFVVLTFNNAPLDTCQLQQCFE